MKIHVLSDLHNEFQRIIFKEPFLPVQKVPCDVVVLAGDIDYGVHGLEWAKKTFSVPVIFVPGNHEYYFGHLEETKELMRMASGDGAFFLDQDEIVIDGVRFLGVTAWTDYTASGNQPLAMLTARNSINDYQLIFTPKGHATPEDVLERNLAARRWLEEKLAQPFDGPTVVVTHHAPSTLSIDRRRFEPGHLDASFANRWESLMGNGVAAWIHGHTHNFCDYEMAGTRVVANPRGYAHQEEHHGNGFRPDFVIEV